MNTVSVLVMASNEAPMIVGCLRLLDWADEVVVLVDDRSTDETARLATDLGARVFVEPWLGFAGQRDRLAELAASDWLFYLDADERVTAALAEEIVRVTGNGDFDIYSVPTQNIFLGRAMRAGGWCPDAHLRLIRKANFIHWTGVIHEAPMVQGRSSDLISPIVHLGHRNLTSMLVKTAVWSELEGQKLCEGRSERVGTGALLAAIGRELRRRLIRRAGWRDGTEGWIEMLYQSFSSFISVAQDRELQRSEPLHETYKRLDAHLQAGGSVADFRGLG